MVNVLIKEMGLIMRTEFPVLQKYFPVCVLVLRIELKPDYE